MASPTSPSGSNCILTLWGSPSPISLCGNTVSDGKIDGGLMAILYRDYFDSVKIPTEINLTPNFLHIVGQCLISAIYLQREKTLNLFAHCHKFS